MDDVTKRISTPETVSKEVLLKLLQFGEYATITECMSRDKNLKLYLSHVEGLLSQSYVGWKTWIASKPGIARTHIKYPSDWWQAVRERWMPRWWIRRHPVVYREAEFDIAELYPDLLPALPDHKPLYYAVPVLTETVAPLLREGEAPPPTTTPK